MYSKTNPRDLLLPHGIPSSHLPHSQRIVCCACTRSHQWLRWQTPVCVCVCVRMDGMYTSAGWTQSLPRLKKRCSPGMCLKNYLDSGQNKNTEANERTNERTNEQPIERANKLTHESHEWINQRTNDEQMSKSIKNKTVLKTHEQKNKKRMYERTNYGRNEGMKEEKNEGACQHW